MLLDKGEEYLGESKELYETGVTMTSESETGRERHGGDRDGRGTATEKTEELRRRSTRRASASRSRSARHPRPRARRSPRPRPRSQGRCEKAAEPVSPGIETAEQKAQDTLDTVAGAGKPSSRAARGQNSTVRTTGRRPVKRAACLVHGREVRMPAITALQGLPVVDPTGQRLGAVDARAVPSRRAARRRPRDACRVPLLLMISRKPRYLRARPIRVRRAGLDRSRPAKVLEGVARREGHRLLVGRDRDLARSCRSRPGRAASLGLVADVMFARKSGRVDSLELLTDGSPPTSRWAVHELAEEWSSASTASRDGREPEACRRAPAGGRAAAAGNGAAVAAPPRRPPSWRQGRGGRRQAA